MKKTEIARILDEAVNGTVFDGINHDDDGLLDAIRHEGLPTRYHKQVRKLQEMLRNIRGDEES